MPLKLPFSTIHRFTVPREPSQCNCKRAARRLTLARPLAYTTKARHQNSLEGEREERPRWQQTPRGMRAPVSLKTYKPHNDYPVNEDPRRLDDVFVQVLGPGGDEMLTDEVKWLAVTHKSFDQGRRGYNDRLAFLGKRIVDLQTSLAILSTQASSEGSSALDEFGREPFQHSALKTLPRLTEDLRKATKAKRSIAEIAERYGLLSVLRWKPKMASDLQGSGSELALAQALYAIVGAVSLQRGGEVANTVTRERILTQLRF